MINILFVYFQSGNKSLFLFIPATHDVSVMQLKYTTATFILRPVSQLYIIEREKINFFAINN